jgi:hypothetical protein
MSTENVTGYLPGDSRYGLTGETKAAPGTPVIQLHLTRGPSLKAELIDPNLPVATHDAALQTHISVRRI